MLLSTAPSSHHNTISTISYVYEQSDDSAKITDTKMGFLSRTPVSVSWPKQTITEC